MVDKTIARAFGMAFGLLAENPTDEHKQIAYLIWKEIDTYDFQVCQMEADWALVKLDLAWEGIDPRWPEEGETIIFGPVNPKMKVNTINAYVCPNGHWLITRDGDQKTTPLTITCRQCVAEDNECVAYSSYYYVDQSLHPTHEWYAPRYPDRITDLPTRQHCQSGGLLLREVGQGDYTIDLAATPARLNRPMRFSELAMRALGNVKR